MIVQILSELGPWSWFIIGLLLLVGEVVLPGVFLIWFGLSALVIGTLTLATFTDVAWWPWQAQVVAFGVLSLVMVMIGNKLFPSNSQDDEASKINDPLGKFVGHEATLIDPISNGVGRIKLGDTTWRVTGDDLPSGSKVRVIGSKDGALLIEPSSN